MAELQQPLLLLPDHQSPINGALLPPTLPPPPLLPPQPLPDTSAAFLGTTKRQRRPSVRLGEIGERRAASDAHARRAGPKFLKPSSAHRDANSKFSSKTRALTNLVAEGCLDPLEAEPRGGVGQNFESLVGFRRGSRDAKAKRLGGPIARRVRTNWFSKFDEGVECTGEMKSTGGEEVKDEDNYREYEYMRRDDSVSPVREQNRSDRRTGRVRVSESREAGPSAVDAVEMDVPSDSGGRDWNNGRSWLVEDGGVLSWLNGLGLARYAPVFEIHEVDDEVLPLLTLDDLKDMGINAVGSRRKMYAAIQKLGKTFTS